MLPTKTSELVQYLTAYHQLAEHCMAQEQASQEKNFITHGEPMSISSSFQSVSFHFHCKLERRMHLRCSKKNPKPSAQDSDRHLALQMATGALTLLPIRWPGIRRSTSFCPVKDQQTRVLEARTKQSKKYKIISEYYVLTMSHRWR